MTDPSLESVRRALREGRATKSQPSADEICLVTQDSQPARSQPVRPVPEQRFGGSATRFGIAIDTSPPLPSALTRPQRFVPVDEPPEYQASSVPSLVGDVLEYIGAALVLLGGAIAAIVAACAAAFISGLVLAAVIGLIILLPILLFGGH